MNLKWKVVELSFAYRSFRAINFRAINFRVINFRVINFPAVLSTNPWFYIPESIGVHVLGVAFRTSQLYGLPQSCGEALFYFPICGFSPESKRKLPASSYFPPHQIFTSGRRIIFFGIFFVVRIKSI